MNEALTQCDKILRIMYENRNTKRVWYGKDFQHEPYFIGYEATARMSDLIRMYPQIFIVRKDGRFRTMEMDFTQEEYIKELLGINGNNI